MTSAVFPKSIVPWTDRIDEVNVIWANDPNTLAAEVIAMETVMGVMPQVEKSPYIGTSVPYATIDARMSDIVAGTLHPYVTLSANDFYVYNNEQYKGQYGHCNSYNKVYDEYDLYNGSDITIQASGLYLIIGQQTWEWHDSGYCFHHCYVNNNWCCGDRWYWNFASTGPGCYQDTRTMTTYFSSLIPVAAGQRVQAVSENGTSRNPYHVLSSTLSAYCLRKLPQSAF